MGQNYPRGDAQCCQTFQVLKGYIAFVIQTEMKTVTYDLLIKKITFYLFMSDFVSDFSEKKLSL